MQWVIQNKTYLSWLLLQYKFSFDRLSNIQDILCFNKGLICSKHSYLVKSYLKDDRNIKMIANSPVLIQNLFLWWNKKWPIHLIFWLSISKYNICGTYYLVNAASRLHITVYGILIVSIKWVHMIDSMISSFPWFDVNWWRILFSFFSPQLEWFWTFLVGCREMDDQMDWLLSYKLILYLKYLSTKTIFNQQILSGSSSIWCFGLITSINLGPDHYLYFPKLARPYLKPSTKLYWSSSLHKTWMPKRSWVRSVSMMGGPMRSEELLLKIIKKWGRKDVIQRRSGPNEGY